MLIESNDGRLDILTAIHLDRGAELRRHFTLMNIEHTMYVIQDIKLTI
ncbi:MAG: hypothetical protein ACXVIU_11655 [Halobacteriota archaeon]